MYTVQNMVQCVLECVQINPYKVCRIKKRNGKQGKLLSAEGRINYKIKTILLVT